MKNDSLNNADSQVLDAFSHSTWEKARTAGQPELLKRELPLLDYLRRHQWTGRQIGTGAEHVGLCPLHSESHPSFYVNATKNLFYCHGCGSGGDLVRFVQLYFHLSFRDSLTCLENELRPSTSYTADEALEDAVAFFQYHLHKHAEALDYLRQRGLHHPELIRQLGIGYAPGGSLRCHLTLCGYSFDFLCQLGLVNQQGRDTFFRRIVFPILDQNRFVNLYGRSIGGPPAHRFLPRTKGGLFAWQSVRDYPTVILVEGLFDLAVLWQAGFFNATCSLGTSLTPLQLSQLCDQPQRHVFIAFDSDSNGAGRCASLTLARRLREKSLTACIVELPEGHDPNSYFVSGATAEDFAFCLQQAQPLRL